MVVIAVGMINIVRVGNNDRDDSITLQIVKIYPVRRKQVPAQFSCLLIIKNPRCKFPIGIYLADIGILLIFNSLIIEYLIVLMP